MNEPFSVTTAHRDMVAGLVKPGAEIKEQLTPAQAHLWHMATGIAGEAGEILDVIKKLVVYQKPHDEKLQQHLIEELGDLEFYLEGLRQTLEITRESVLAANIIKLGARYKGHKYSDEQAINRVDKAATTNE